MSQADNAMILLKAAIKAKDFNSIETAFATLMEVDPAAARKVREDLINQGFNRSARTTTAGA